MGIPVTLHIYDVSTDPHSSQLNEYLTALGTGAFHGAVEVDGLEWSYGYSSQGTGVFSNKPKGCKAHHYRCSEKIGDTSMSQKEIKSLIETMKKEWPGTEYDLLRHNCCVFSNALCERLGVGPIPRWVTNLAATGATVTDGLIKGVDAAQCAAIIAKAKANEFDAKYINGEASAKAKDVINGLQGINQKYHITASIAGAGGKVASLIEQGPEGIRVLAFMGGFGSCVLATLGIASTISKIGVDTVMYSHMILSGYMIIFAFTTMIFEAKPEWIQKAGHGIDVYQNTLLDNCAFLSQVLGRGLFYAFQGSIWTTFWESNLIGYCKLVLGVYYWIGAGFHVAMHFGVMPKDVVEKLRAVRTGGGDPSVGAVRLVPQA